MRRIFRWAAALLAVGCIAAVTFTATKVLWPHLDHPRSGDAVVVLAGDHGERFSEARRLLQAGIARTLVLAGTPDTPKVAELCIGGQPFEVVCLAPTPDNTRAEARATAQLAVARRWQKVIVVTSVPHVTRTRLLFKRCFAGAIDVVGAELPFGGSQLRHAQVHEVLGLLYARLWARGC